MVEFDAFAGDIALGGLRNMLEIKILVCYMLSRVKEPMTRKQLCDCLQEEGLVNFFDLIVLIHNNTPAKTAMIVSTMNPGSNVTGMMSALVPKIMKQKKQPTQRVPVLKSKSEIPFLPIN